LSYDSQKWWVPLMQNLLPSLLNAAQTHHK
jgi:hypothetical protein